MYSVELTDDSFFPPLEMGKELASMGLSLLDELQKQLVCMKELYNCRDIIIGYC